MSASSTEKDHFACARAIFFVSQLLPSYVLKLEEPYERAVAVHLVRRAARDEGLKVAHTSRDHAAMA